MLRSVLLVFSLITILSSMVLDLSESFSLDPLVDYDKNATYYTYTDEGSGDSIATASLEVESTNGGGDSTTTGKTYTQYLGSYARTWLELHNQRRKKYSAMYGYEYVPLMWSRVIARSAQAYADVLSAGRCSDFHHDPSNNGHFGENLAYLTGMDSPEQVLTMWVEGELVDPNAVLTTKSMHMTQVLWRSTHYVGCGTARNSECYLYVCRYITPGNCNLRLTSWLTDTMQEQSPCPSLPRCPPGEGCFSPAD